jgi:cystathionine gamma-synthase
VVSYWDQGAEKRAEIGIKDNLVRMSCGIEDYEDIEADIIQALDSIQDVVVTEEAVRAGAAA